MFYISERISPYARHWEEFEDIKGKIIIHKSNRDIQQNGHKKKDKRTNNDKKKNPLRIPAPLVAAVVLL